MAFAYADVRCRDMQGPSSAAVRFVLGMGQMAAATVAAVLLWLTGVSFWSLAFVLAACVLTTIRVLLFGSRGPHMSGGPDGRRRM